MFTVSIRFPSPSRYGYGTTGTIKTTKLIFPPQSRYIQPLNYCCNNSGSGQMSTLLFPKQLRFIQPVQYSYCTEGKEQTAIAALQKPQRYMQQLCCNNCNSGKESTTSIAFSKFLRYVQQLSGCYKSSGRGYYESIVFPKQLRYVQKLYYDYHAKDNGQTALLILSLVKNFQHGKILFGYDAKEYKSTQLKFQYDYKNYIGTKLLFTFDWIKRVETKWSWKQSVLVRAGWKIMARDTATSKIYELGFIDAENPEHLLTNVELPESDYEIFVLTSSLFWKNCQDRNIRMLSTRNGKEFSAFPNIYHLRSSISQGMTVIEWSASQCDADDYLFGIWYSSEMPVDITRLPDTTITYVSSQTEYRTTFYQNAPVYLALAAMRTGNKPENGNIHELYLDWNTSPPRAPNDIIVLNPPLPALDPNREIIKQEYPNLTLWG
jgi:hypothetical protein